MDKISDFVSQWLVYQALWDTRVDDVSNLVGNNMSTWQTLLDEAENERMHLMTFINIAQPTLFERFLIMFAQFIFIVLYLFIYLISPRTAHRIVGYFEEEAVISYTQYLEEVESGKIENVKAPKIAIDYWNLPLNSTLKDVIKVVRDDEAGHRDLNHSYANILNNKEDPNEEQLQH